MTREQGHDDGLYPATQAKKMCPKNKILHKKLSR